MSNYPFRIIEKEYKSNFTSRVKAIDYDARYYANDKNSPAEDLPDYSGIQDPTQFYSPCIKEFVIYGRVVLAGYMTGTTGTSTSGSWLDPIGYSVPASYGGSGTGPSGLGTYPFLQLIMGCTQKFKSFNWALSQTGNSVDIPGVNSNYIRYPVAPTGDVSNDTTTTTPVPLDDTTSYPWRATSQTFDNSAWIIPSQWYKGWPPNWSNPVSGWYTRYGNTAGIDQPNEYYWMGLSACFRWAQNTGAYFGNVANRRPILASYSLGTLY